MKKIVCIVGATATGKTRLGVELARVLGGEIVSADSMQIYKKMDIATAKPTLAERGGIPHHMIDIVEPSCEYSVAEYVRDATRIIDNMSSLAIVVGGTGMYTDSLVSGASFATYDAEIRRGLEEELAREGARYMYERLCKCDSESAKTIHPNNVKRVLRALEIYTATGNSMKCHTVSKKARYDAIYICLGFRDRQLLYSRINARVDAMIEAGLVAETRALIADGIDENATSMQAIGYKECLKALRGEEELSQAVERIKQATRNYAKRQITWFKRNSAANWIYIDDYNDFSEILHASTNLLTSFGIIDTEVK